VEKLLESLLGTIGENMVQLKEVETEVTNKDKTLLIEVGLK